MQGEIRALAAWSIATSVFAALLAITTLAEIGFAGRAVKEYYAERAIIEAVAREHFSEPPPDYPLAIFAERLVRPSLTVTAPGGNSITRGNDLFDDSALFAAVGLALGLLGFGVAALGWVWRAHSNLRAAGVTQQYGPSKALFAYIVPVANLALAPDAMRELYNRSHGEPEELVKATVDDVTAWWTAGIAGTVIASGLIAKYMVDIGSNLAIMTPLWMEYAMAAFAILLLLGCAILFARLTRQITRAQAEYLVGIVDLPEPAPVVGRGVRLVRTEEQAAD